MLEYSRWSSSLIRIPPPATTSDVADTITLAAIRIDGGSRMNFDMHRSTRFAAFGRTRRMSRAGFGPGGVVTRSIISGAAARHHGADRVLRTRRTRTARTGA